MINKLEKNVSELKENVERLEDLREDQHKRLKQQEDDLSGLTK